MSNETQAPPAVPSLEPNPWTDERVLVETGLLTCRAFVAGAAFGVPIDAQNEHCRLVADAVLAALAPRLVERERAAAAKVLREFADWMDDVAEQPFADAARSQAGKIEQGRWSW